MVERVNTIPQSPSPFILVRRTSERLKVTTLLGGSVIGSPVRGFLPVRPCFSFTENFPNPMMETSSPFCRDCFMSSKRASMIRFKVPAGALPINGMYLKASGIRQCVSGRPEKRQGVPLWNRHFLNLNDYYTVRRSFGFNSRVCVNGVHFGVFASLTIRITE